MSLLSGDAVKPAWKRCLVLSGCAALAAGVLHIGIIFGGPAWFRFSGAPEHIIRMAAAGHWYPTVVCLVIAAVLGACAAYAFSGAGLLRRLPFLRFALALIGSVLSLRGLVFLPIMLLSPSYMTRITSSTGIDAFLVVTSFLCLAMGLAYLAACLSLKAQSSGTLR